MKKTKRYQTNLISSIIVLVMLVLFVLLGIMLINHTKLETRFDAIISMLERIDKAVANLDTEREILVCIAALYIAKCQLPIPLSFLCVISGMVFPIREALLINIAGIMFFFCVKYFEGMWIGGGWAGMVLYAIGFSLKATEILMFCRFHALFRLFRSAWFQNTTARLGMTLCIIAF